MKKQLSRKMVTHNIGGDTMDSHFKFLFEMEIRVQPSALATDGWYPITHTSHRSIRLISMSRYVPQSKLSSIFINIFTKDRIRQHYKLKMPTMMKLARIFRAGT
jgi:hypothetical protein